MTAKKKVPGARQADGILFYHNWKDYFALASDEAAGKLWKAVLRFRYELHEPQLEYPLNVFFNSMRDAIIIDWIRYEASALVSEGNLKKAHMTFDEACNMLFETGHPCTKLLTSSSREDFSSAPPMAAELISSEIIPSEIIPSDSLSYRAGTPAGDLPRDPAGDLAGTPAGTPAGGAGARFEGGAAPHNEALERFRREHSDTEGR